MPITQDYVYSQVQRRNLVMDQAKEMRRDLGKETKLRGIWK
jgi:hypothetical protein